MLRHFCFQHHPPRRRVSTGTYASLNCTPYTGDSAENVLRNQGLLLEALPQRPQELVIPWQTHGTASLVIDTDYLQADPQTRHESLQGIDALITRERSICLCISTADCIPILLYDQRHRAIAAVHAGWRGTVNRIVRHTLERMQTLYATEGKDVQAVIGPGISLAAFEVGEEVYEAFRAAEASHRPVGRQPAATAGLRSARHADRDRRHLYLHPPRRLLLCPQAGNQVGQDAVGNHD